MVNVQRLDNKMLHYCTHAFANVCQNKCNLIKRMRNSKISTCSFDKKISFKNLAKRETVNVRCKDVTDLQMQTDISESFALKTAHLHRASPHFSQLERGNVLVSLFARNNYSSVILSLNRHVFFVPSERVHTSNIYWDNYGLSKHRDASWHVFSQIQRLMKAGEKKKHTFVYVAAIQCDLCNDLK